MRSLFKQSMQGRTCVTVWPPPQIICSFVVHESRANEPPSWPDRARRGSCAEFDGVVHACLSGEIAAVIRIVVLDIRLNHALFAKCVFSKAINLASPWRQHVLKPALRAFSGSVDDLCAWARLNIGLHQLDNFAGRLWADCPVVTSDELLRLAAFIGGLIVSVRTQACVSPYQLPPGDKGDASQSACAARQQLMPCASNEGFHDGPVG